MEIASAIDDHQGNYPSHEEREIRVKSELEESESKFRKIIHSSLDAVIMIDHHGVVTEWNQQSEQMFGFKKEEAVQHLLADLIIPKQYRESHERGMSHYMKSGEGPVLNTRIEITAIGKDKDEFPIELSIVPIEIKGQQYFSAFLRDISVQKASQNKLEEALSREKELNEMKSKFVSMTSHEFRTPLTAIKSNIDLLAYKMDNGIEMKSMTKNVARIQNELKRLINLMNDILTIGRIESGRIPFNPVPTLLYQLVVHVMNQSFAERSDGKSVQLRVKGEEKELMIDSQIFSHVITNLVSNAFKYSEGKPSPSLTLNYDDENAWVVVEDQGIGIPEEEMEHLSESFYRASNVGNIQGSGLGLTIVRQFVAMHDGELMIESRIDQGTKVSIQLPYADKAE